MFKTFIATTIFVLLLAAMPIIAQEGTADNAEEQSAQSSVDKEFVVQEIAFSGLKSLNEDLLRDLIQTAPGDEISTKKLSKDIKEIYVTEFFSDVSVDVEPVETGGFRVKYVLTENPKLKGDVEIIGNAELGFNKLKDEVTLKPGEFYSEYDLWKTKHNILELYKKEGFYLANVDADVTEVPDSDEVTVAIQVEEGERVKIVEVNFTGNEHATYKSLRKVMETRKGKRFDDEALENDILMLKEHYHERGFMYVRIDEPKRTFTEDKTGLIIDINIEEGPQFLIGDFKIEFKNELEKRPFSEEKIFSMLELGEGDIFNKTLFWQDTDKIRQAYSDKGYLMAAITPDANYDDENALIDITLKISEGIVIEIGDLFIEGLTKTKEGVILRELNRLDIKKGERYNVQNLRKATRKIYTIGSFIRGVNFDLGETESEDRKDLTVRVIETPSTGLFTLFGGYGSEGGLMGGIEIGNENLFGKAYQVRLKGELGTNKKRTGQIQLSTPWILNTPTRLSLSLYSLQSTRRLYSTWSDIEGYGWAVDKRYGGSITLGRPITKTIDASLRFRDENGYTEWRELLSAESDDNTGWRETRSITSFMERDARDYYGSLFNPISGSLNSLSFEYSGGIFGADNSFQKYSYETRWYRKIWKNTVLATRLKVGYLRGDIWTNDKSEFDKTKLRLLYFERYVLGGIDTVRGYEDQVINPDIINPDTEEYRYYGGNKMFYFNFEYRIPITVGGLSLVTFYDMGQTWNEETNLENFKFNPKKGVGIGGRLEMPQMGIVLRIEYGYGFDREEPGGRIHWALSPSF